MRHMMVSDNGLMGAIAEGSIRTEFTVTDLF